VTNPTNPPSPFATQADVEVALGRPLNPGLDPSLLLLSASDLVTGYLNGVVPNPLPDLIVRVTAEMVAAALNHPQMPPDPADDAYNTGQFAYQVGPMSVGPWLTKSQRERLDLYGSGGVTLMEAISEVVGSDTSWDIMDSFDPYAGTDLGGYGEPGS
jgi:hypothetical protein